MSNGKKQRLTNDLGDKENVTTIILLKDYTLYVTLLS